MWSSCFWDCKDSARCLVDSQDSTVQLWEGGCSVEVPPWRGGRGSSQWLKGTLVWDRRSRWGSESVRCNVQQLMRLGGRMTWTIFVAHNPNVLSHACRVMCVLRKLCNDCALENVACGRCICLRLPLIARELKISGKRHGISEQEKKTGSVQDEVRQEFQLSFDFWSSCCSQWVDEDEGVGRDRFPWWMTRIKSPSCSRINWTVVIIHVAILFAVAGLCFLLSPVHVFVVQSFAFTLCFNEYRTLFQWSLDTLSVHREFSRISRFDFFLLLSQ